MTRSGSVGGWLLVATLTSCGGQTAADHNRSPTAESGPSAGAPAGGATGAQGGRPRVDPGGASAGGRAVTGGVTNDGSGGVPSGGAPHGGGPPGGGDAGTGAAIEGGTSTAGRSAAGDGGILTGTAGRDEGGFGGSSANPCRQRGTTTVPNGVDDPAGDSPSNDLVHLSAALDPTHLELRLTWVDAAPVANREWGVAVARAPRAELSCHVSGDFLLSGNREPILSVGDQATIWSTGDRMMLDACRYLAVSDNERTLRLLLPRERFGFDGPFWVAHGAWPGADRVPNAEGSWIEATEVDRFEPFSGSAVCDAHREQVRISEETYVFVDTGTFFACGVTTEGTVRCSDGPQPEPAGTFVELGAYFETACGLRPDGSVECWGGEPRQPPAGSYLQVARHGVGWAWALRTDGALVGWELNEAGRVVVDGPFRAIDGGCALDTVGAIHCYDHDTGRMVERLPGPYTALSGGWGFVCGMDVDGQVVCLHNGELFVPSGGPFREVAAGGNEACAITRDGELLCFGIGFAVRHVVPLELTSLSAPIYDVCGLLPDARAACWPGVSLP